MRIFGSVPLGGGVRVGASVPVGRVRGDALRLLKILAQEALAMIALLILLIVSGWSHYFFKWP